ncbi:GntR family transcriptional regulator (plasmid) [Paroceanicella profunda]|uniref:GntR family transcriptional regulator n=1 Tax=Paroceanicella profunda TaxID=2579971 RepID=A0A5B8G2P4_9RHOB|nr:GntR family transcriptional regulator [Paroceanicella profunda]QDL94354.1 GntR family transcriptional regulator [Paroceanicella profunda]
MSRNPFSTGQTEGPGPASAHVPASARVYEALRGRIVALELPPGSALGRAEIAQSFNVSQSPVREAILRLEQDGLVLSYPQSRTLVTRIDRDRLREEHFLRTAVEADVARALALQSDPGTAVKLRGMLKMQEALAGEVEQIDLFKQLDEAFHEALFAGVNQLNLHRHVTARCGHLARVRSLDLPRKGKMRAVLDGHRAVVEAIAAGDAAAASGAMRLHLSGTIERLPEIVRENGAFFT